jgi:hypothetical protein
MKSSVKGDVKEAPKKEVSQDELFDLVKDLQGKIATLEANKRSEITVEGNTELIAADDFLESPAIFFAYSTSYVVGAKDKRRGKYVENPTGDLIKFRKAYRYERRGSGKRGVDIVSTCSVKVQSKQLAEWMRGHTLFGIKFFENMADAANVDVTFAEKMSQVQRVINSMSDMQIIERARAIGGIHVNTPDTDHIRKQLVEKMARNEMEKESKEKVDRYVQGQGKQEKKIDERKIATGAVQASPY